MTYPVGESRRSAVYPAIMGMMGGIVLCLVLRGGPVSTVRAQSSPMTSDGSGTIALNLTTPGGPPMIALVDTREKALAVYRIDPTRGASNLESSRPYRFDLKLEFNPLPPEVHAVEAMVQATSRK